MSQHTESAEFQYKIRYKLKAGIYKALSQKNGEWRSALENHSPRVASLDLDRRESGSHTPFPCLSSRNAGVAFRGHHEVALVGRLYAGPHPAVPGQWHVCQELEAGLRHGL